MSKARHVSLALGALAAALIAVACETEPIGAPSFGVKPPPPPKKGGECANYRLTGGGRTDQRSEHPHSGFAKSTPESHDFATFGFQARPDGCPSTGGSGQQEWNEHGDAAQNAFGAPFAFHGRVTFFTTPDPADPSTPESECGRYGGSGRLNFRSGVKVDATFVVNHACDVAEPGVGKDHIDISITRIDNGVTYRRHGLLSGGNIQWHRLTGNN